MYTGSFIDETALLSHRANRLFYGALRLDSLLESLAFFLPLAKLG